MDVDEIVHEESAEKKRDMKDVLRDKKDPKRPVLVRGGKGAGCQLALAQEIRTSSPVGSL